VSGIAAGCRENSCALIGGETAEMPGLYSGSEYDLAGFAVGVVEKSRIIDGSGIAPGDTIVGLAGNGPHSNGYSLIRKIVTARGIDLKSSVLDGQPLADLLLAPTRIYVKPVLDLLRRVPVKGLAHITGGGLLENVPRVLASPLTARIDAHAWRMPPVFTWLKREGNVSEPEMFRVFNCGIGMVLILDSGHVETAMALLTAAGETVFRLGEIAERAAHEAQTIIA
jgi:phosphoribosylformylglycinamidine cyclo-ligase